MKIRNDQRCWLMALGLVTSSIFVSCQVAIITDPVKRPDHRFFLRQLFDKYGDNGIITFEGFEHLLESLGLGRLSFDKKHDVSDHRINGSFRDVHDILNLHDHRHGINEIVNSPIIYQESTLELDKIDNTFVGDNISSSSSSLLEDIDETRRDEYSKIVKRNTAKDTGKDSTKIEPDYGGLCLSPQMLLQTFGLRPNHSVAIKPSRFLQLCPAIIYQLDQRACSVRVSSIDSPSSTITRSSKSIDSFHASLYAGLATLVISSVGLVAVSMVRLTQREELLYYLVALAAGTLSGDALLHLLPHALLSEDIGHEDVTFRCAATLMAVIFFYLLEGVLIHVHSSRATKKVRELEKEPTSRELENIRRNISDPDTRDCEDVAVVMLPPLKDHGYVHGHGHGHANSITVDSSSSSLKYLVLVGDALHNFTDGLAIGASFASDPVAGLATTIAVFCHELPHELGDFAVLINAGMSVKKALFYNALSSGLSFIGAAFGIWLGEFKDATHWIYAITAGTFLYIALVDLMPELMTHVRKVATIRGLFVQLAGFSSGGALMMLIAIYEERLHELIAP